MERLKSIIWLAVLLLASGCANGTRLSNWRDDILLEGRPHLPGNLSTPARPELPPLNLARGPAVLVNDPAVNQKWNLTLEESLVMGLANMEIVRTLNSGTVAASPFTPYDPIINEETKKAALAAFDTQFAASIYHNRINQPSGSFFGPGIPESVRRNEQSFNASLIKPWVTGGQTRVAYNPPLGFLFLPGNAGSGFFNPFYTSNIELAHNQPLLKGAGAKVNRAPIVIAQIKVDQSAWQVKQSVLSSVRSVMEAYYTLQASQQALQAIDDLLPPLEQVVNIQEQRLKQEMVIRSDLVRARMQLHLARQQRFQAQSAVLASELALRNLLGIPPGDGRTIMPVSPPSRAQIALDPARTLDSALVNRPDIVYQRLNVRIKELQLMVARNGFLPQLDAQALYRFNGLGGELDQALIQMFGAHFTDWQAGLTFSVPLGRRVASAGVRSAQQQLDREIALMRQSIHSTAFVLTDTARQVNYSYAQYLEAEKRLEEANLWYEGARLRYENPPPLGEGVDWLLVTLNDYLLALRAKADARTDVAALVAAYNTQLMRLEEAMGTLLTTYNIHMINDPCGPTLFRQFNTASHLDVPAMDWRMSNPPQIENGNGSGIRPELVPLPPTRGDVLPLPSVRGDVTPLPSIKTDLTPLPSVRDEVLPLPSVGRDVVPLPSVGGDIVPLPSVKLGIGASPPVLEVLPPAGPILATPAEEGTLQRLPRAELVPSAVEGSLQRLPNPKLTSPTVEESLHRLPNLEAVPPAIDASVERLPEVH